MKQMDGRSLSANWGRAFRCLLLLSLLASLAATAVPRAEAAQRVHPALLQLAAKQPDAKVGVIVQKQTKNTNAESMVPKLGGTVTKDLSIINAFAAEMPAKGAVELSKLNGVRWVSPDAPTTSSTVGQFTTWATEISNGVSTSVWDEIDYSPIANSNYIWFNAVMTVSGLPSAGATINFDKSTIQFTANGVPYTLDVPDASVTYRSTTARGTTTFDAVKGTWVTALPNSTATSNVFLTGMRFKPPTTITGTPIGLTWSGRILSDTPGLTVTWKWSLSVYTNLSSDYSALGVKPCTSSSCSNYNNSDKAATPENFKSFLISGGRGTGGTNYTGTLSDSGSVGVPTLSFNNSANMVDSPSGPNAVYGNGSNDMASFGGFTGEKNLNSRITRVEAALRAYVPASFTVSSANNPKLTVKVGSVSGSNVIFTPAVFNPYVGAANAGTVYIDITSSRTWQWADFDNNMQLTLDQSRFGSGNFVYYDAIGLRVTSDTGTDTSVSASAAPPAASPIDTSRLTNVFNNAIRASNAWNSSTRLQGQGIGVAVVDSGVFKTDDLKGRIVSNINFNPGYHTSTDANGHGTFVAGIIAGNGKKSSRAYMGVAPRANIVNVRVSDDQGMATESDVVSGLQWILDNKARYNIRVINMSLNSGTAQSYHVGPMNAAVEMLWFNGIVVVVSAGNNGTSTLFAPANDPFVITVGATNDLGTMSLSDDTVASFSAYGVAENGAVKPDLVAPGTNIISLLPQNNLLSLCGSHPANQVNANYFRMSGTSMAAPMVAGAVALLLQDEPNLTPDQVKYRLMSTAVKTAGWAGYDPVRAGGGYLDVYGAIQGTTTQSANTGTQASQLLWTGTTPVNWNSVNWNSVNWNSVNWNSVNWNSVNWNSVNWNSDYWGP